MPALNETLNAKLAVLRAKQQLRALEAAQPTGVFVTHCNHASQLINFSSNDYFGLSQHPQVVAAAKAALEQYGTGATASRLVCGNHPLYEQLETVIAAVKKTEAALVFGSGYLANLGTINALMNKNDLIIADRLSHASMLDGAQLSGATLMRFAHNNLDHLQSILETERSEYQNCLILTESVFSMDGDRAPLDRLLQLTERFDAWMLVDDAHGLGIVHTPYSPSLVTVGTLSKGVGSYGGYVCGSRILVDYLINHARSFIFSTGLPPAVIAGAATALSLLHSDPLLQQKPLALARQFTSELNLADAQSPIVPIILGENDKALNVAAVLREQGFFVRAIRPPTVPSNTARLRITFSALHQPQQVSALVKAIKPFL